MNKDLVKNIEDLLAKTKKTWQLLDLDASATRMKILEAQMNESDFWNDQDKAKQVSKEHEDLKSELETWKNIQVEIKDVLE